MLEEVHNDEYYNYNNISGWDILFITTGYTVYISTLSLLIQVIGFKILRSRNARKFIFIVATILLHLLILYNFSQANQWEYLDKKGQSSEFLFVIISFCLMVANVVFWTVKNKEYFRTESYNRPDGLPFLRAVRLFYLLLSISIAGFLLSSFNLDVYQLLKDGLLIEDRMIYWIGIATLLSLPVFIGVKAGLPWKTLQTAYTVMLIIAAIFFHINFSNKVRSLPHTTYREILIYYNPVWLDDDSRGHTKFSI